MWLSLMATDIAFEGHADRPGDRAPDIRSGAPGPDNSDNRTTAQIGYAPEFFDLRFLHCLARCLDRRMATEQEGPRVVSASREIVAGPGPIFELIADPAAQPRWDGNDNLVGAPAGQRVRRAGDVFTMTLTRGGVRENHVVEFEEGCRIAWLPAEPGQEPPGHLWRWELEPAGPARTRVTHTYDWTRLTDEKRLPRARATTAGQLQASLDRLAALAEGS